MFSVRTLCFFGVFLAMTAWEYLRPRRLLSPGRSQRWPINLGLFVIDVVSINIIVGMWVYAGALFAQAWKFGILNWLHCPVWLGVPLTFLVLDLAVYRQHVAFHKIGWLWRLHRVHHSDLGFDVTTGVRFHPLEIFISIVWKLFIVLLLGATPVGVLAFEIILNATSLFNHGNVAIPERIDAKVRRWIVTPDMHRIHHSSIKAETDSNFSFSLSIWDHIFSTYHAEPELGQTRLEIGLREYRDPSAIKLGQLLSLPFKP